MLLLGDCSALLKDINDNSIDLIVTDPPYGLVSDELREGKTFRGGFMGKDWDKALVSTETWKECYRVLKEGKLAFVMCSPRQDVLSRMILNLQDAGFRTNYSSIYWTYSQGFPKAANVSKLIDKNMGRLNSNTLKLKNRLNELRKQKDISIPEMNRLCGFEAANYFRTDNHLISIFPQGEKWIKIKNILGENPEIDKELQSYFEEAEREIISTQSKARSEGKYNIALPSMGAATRYIDINITKPATEEAKKMEGSYVGFQPKPAVEVILVVSKGKTISWLDDVRIPYQSEDDRESTKIGFKTVLPPEKGWNNNNMDNPESKMDLKGRFPANLLVSDDVLNDGKITKSLSRIEKPDSVSGGVGTGNSLTFPHKDLNPRHPQDEGSYSRYFSLDSWAEKTLPFLIVAKASKSERGEFNVHPTVKALKLMSYLITMAAEKATLS